MAARVRQKASLSIKTGVNMKLFRKVYLVVLVALLFAYAASQVFAGNVLGTQYSNLLKKQGYTPLNHPRSSFGVGTIIPLDSKKNIFIAAPDDCFPDLAKGLVQEPIKLIDSKDVKNLTINASGSYSPTGAASFLSKIAAAFGYSNKATMDVKYGDTTAIDLTEVALQKYLVTHKITASCGQALKNPKNALIFSMASVASMTYSFSGQKTVSGSASADALKSAMSASGDVKYEHDTDNSVTITSPLYVGYNAYSLKTLEFGGPESGAGVNTISSLTIAKVQAKIPE
jgi:hypothetical protein